MSGSILTRIWLERTKKITDIFIDIEGIQYFAL